MTTLHHIKPAMIAAAWPHIAPLVQKIIETDPHKLTIEDALHLLAADELQLFAAVNEAGEVLACLVTEMKQFPRMKRCELVGLAGRDRNEWVDCLDEIEQWARERGCSRIRIRNGRLGWRKEPKLQSYTRYCEFERSLS
jgi:hypothetical protein